MTQQHLLFLKWHVHYGLRNIIQRIKSKYMVNDDNERYNEGKSKVLVIFDKIPGLMRDQVNWWVGLSLYKWKQVCIASFCPNML